MADLSMIGRSDTIDVSLNPLVLLWMKEKCKRDPIAFCRLIENNKKRFKRLFGTGVNAEEYGYDLAWGIEELGIPIYILSSPKGTIYKIHYPGGDRAFAADRKIGSAITAFLEKLLLDLSGFGINKKG